MVEVFQELSAEDTSEEGSQVQGEVLARKLERQVSTAVLTPAENTINLHLHAPSYVLSPQCTGTCPNLGLPVHPRQRVEWLRTAAIFYNWRHFGFSFLAPLQTITTSASFVNQSTSGCLPALIAPGYQPMGELTRQHLHFCGVSSERYLHSCMLMLLNCLLQLLQTELQTWLCGLGSL